MDLVSVRDVVHEKRVTFLVGVCVGLLVAYLVVVVVRAWQLWRIVL